MYIKKLELLNFQVIEEFNANFEGNIYFITGENEIGKSTLLKAIGVLLTGERDALLKNGKDKGFAKMVVGNDGEEYEVDLRFSKANPRGTLTIKQNNTGMKSDNISMLQKIFGYQDFDAVEFSRWSETAEGRRKQIEVVKSLLPESTLNRINEIDKAITDIKLKRKEINAELKTYTTICNNAEKSLRPGDTKKYAQKMDITTLMQEQSDNAKLIEKAKTVRTALENRTKQLNDITNRLTQAEQRKELALKVSSENLLAIQTEVENIIKEAKLRLENATISAEKEKEEIESDYIKTLESINSDKKEFETRKKNAENWLKEYEKQGIENADVSERLKEAEEHNRVNALVVDYLKKKDQKEQTDKKAIKLNDELTCLLNEKEKLISSSDLPITGLTFTDDGLELNGVPFVPGKVSDSQIMEVATQLIIASNPTVKVFRIARGESLGEKRLKAILSLAKEKGYQGFIETVVRGQEELIIQQFTENGIQ